MTFRARAGAAPFAFTRLFAHMFVLLWEGDGGRREKGVVAPNLHQTRELSHILPPHQSLRSATSNRPAAPPRWTLLSRLFFSLGPERHTHTHAHTYTYTRQAGRHTHSASHMPMMDVCSNAYLCSGGVFVLDSCST